MIGWPYVLVLAAAMFGFGWIAARERVLYRSRTVGPHAELRFDTPAARAAMADPDDWFATVDRVVIVPGVLREGDTQ